MLFLEDKESIEQVTYTCLPYVQYILFQTLFQSTSVLQVIPSFDDIVNAVSLSSYLKLSV